MDCSNCGKQLDIIDPETKAYVPIYQVRMGHLNYPYRDPEDFEPDEDVGYYCSECLSKGM